MPTYRITESIKEGLRLIGGLWRIVLLIIFLLALDLAALAFLTDFCFEQGVREGIAWFFGNGSGAQELTRFQLLLCVISALLGYVSLGIILTVVVRSLQNSVPE
jgi:hypothetical protein